MIIITKHNLWLLRYWLGIIISENYINEKHIRPLRYPVLSVATLPSQCVLIRLIRAIIIIIYKLEFSRDFVFPHKLYRVIGYICK